jgi:hypothetical protein
MHSQPPFLLQNLNLILHNVIIVPMHYALCNMHLISLRPIAGPMQMPCSIKFMHYYVMQYEIAYCISLLTPLLAPLFFPFSLVFTALWVTLLYCFSVALCYNAPLRSAFPTAFCTSPSNHYLWIRRGNTYLTSFLGSHRGLLLRTRTEMPVRHNRDIVLFHLSHHICHAPSIPCSWSKSATRRCPCRNDNWYGV